MTTWDAVDKNIMDKEIPNNVKSIVQTLPESVIGLLFP